MTSNSTVRRLTTKRARQLTRVLEHMSKKLKFDSFDLHFVENPFKRVISDWLDQGCNSIHLKIVTKHLLKRYNQYYLGYNEKSRNV